MALVANKIDFKQELARRDEEQAARQSKLDLEEIERRIKAVQTGKSKLIPEAEMWASLEKAGY